MFFPKLNPSSIVGQSFKLAATFLGVAMVSFGGAVHSGPLFREGDKVFMLHTEALPDGATAEITCVDIGEEATTRVIDHTQHIAMLTERVMQDKQAIANLREAIESNVRTIEGYKDTFVQIDQLRKADAAERAAQDTRIAELERRLYDLLSWLGEFFPGDILNDEGLKAAMTAERENAANIAKKLELAETALLQADAENATLSDVVARYVEAVGPLDTPPNVNDEIANQLRLMEPYEEPTAPPPPFIEKLGSASLYGKLDGPNVGESGPTGETIAREGSMTDHAFRRLMFLTGGDFTL